MAFWTMTSSLSMAGATEKILNRDSFTLKDLLDCDDILNQVLAPNDRVINYLSRPEVVEELVNLAMTPAPMRTKRRESTATTNSEPVVEAGSDSEPEQQQPAETEETEPAQTEDAPKFESDYDAGESVEYREFQEDDGSVDIEFDGDADDDDDFEENKFRQIRYSKVSAEILTTDVWMLLDALFSNEKAMNDLWRVLETKEEATAQQLGLFTKIVESLLEKRLDRMLDFIRTLPHFVDHFIRYIECQPLVDFLIKVISTDHPESPTDVIDFLYEQDLVPKMIELLGPEVPHSAQSAAGDFLKAFVNISGGNKSDICAIGPNELSRQFVGARCMGRLIDIMLHGGHGMCVAVTVIIETIRKNNSDYDMIEVTDTTLGSHPPDPRDNIYLGTMVKLFARAIPRFQTMLVAPEPRKMKMPFGEITPLGFERFRICELYAELLHCSNMKLLNDPMGEAIIQERDAERNRIYFPDRELPNILASADGDETIDADPEGEAEAEATDAHSASTVHISAVDPDRSGSDDEDEDDEDETAESPHNSDISQSAHAPDAGPPASPTEIIDSPPQTPSPPTPEPESGDELDYIDDDRQKINVSNYRGKQLEEFLERENRGLRRRSVVGDQLKFALDDNNCIDAVLKMLFEFPWNNFLHNVVFDIVQQVFNGYIDHSYNKFLAIHLFTRAHLTEQIVQGQRANEQHEREKNIRLGYVGHLTLISEEVVKFGSLFIPESVSPEIADALNDRDWIAYVHNDLLQLREQYNTVLGKVSLIEDEDSYDVQEDDERRVLSLELNFNEDDESRMRQLQPRGDSDSDSDSETESESDSDDEDDEEEEQQQLGRSKKHAKDDEGEDEEDDDDDDGTHLPQLRPQRHRKSEDYEDEDEDEESYTQKKGSNRDKIPKDESEFARYMSRQLNSDQFSSESSEEEEDSEGRNDEAWVPVNSSAKQTEDKS